MQFIQDKAHYLIAAVAAMLVALYLSMPAAAQTAPSSDLATIAKDAATNAVAAGAVVAGIVLGAFILYKVIRRFAGA